MSEQNRPTGGRPSLSTWRASTGLPYGAYRLWGRRGGEAEDEDTLRLVAGWSLVGADPYLNEILFRQGRSGGHVISVLTVI
jgi:hypothetical protein